MSRQTSNIRSDQPLLYGGHFKSLKPRLGHEPNENITIYYMLPVKNKIVINNRITKNMVNNFKDNILNFMDGRMTFESSVNVKTFSFITGQFRQNNRRPAV
jgi:hypothetical protein